ncbi:MAG: hypothetical protein HY687_02165 [Chloroflexi bacterium]|nr:hypothetical protein [Chloroflexota bacterium]
MKAVVTGGGKAAYLSGSKGQQAGLAPALRGWLVSLAGGVALGLAVLAFLVLGVPYAVTSPHNLTGFDIITIDGTDKSYAVFADICGDGDHNTPLYFVWVVEKALAGK